MLTLEVCLLHDSARPHTDHVTQALQTFKWHVLGRPSHSPDLARRDYNLFGKLTEHIPKKKSDDDDEAKDEVAK